MCFLTQTKPFAVYLSSSYKEPSPITTLTCAFALAVRLALVHSVWWTHGAIFHSSHLQNLSQGSCPQYSVLWCHQLESGQCPSEVSDTLLLLSHVTACLVTFYHLLYIHLALGYFETHIDTHDLWLQLSKCAVRLCQHISSDGKYHWHMKEVT